MAYSSGMHNLEHQTVYEGQHIRVKTCGRWEYVERTKASAGVAIVALTPENKLILVEQYRVPMQKAVIELPAGLAGDQEDEHEAFLEAAKRELLEETGYEASNWTECAGGPPSAGLSTEVVIFFAARNLRKTSAGGGEGSENIQVHEVALSDLHPWLKLKKDSGLWIDPKIYCGLYFLQNAPASIFPGSA
jgi:ADP-ribose pyrophosphatase